MKFLGLRTLIYPSDNLEDDKKWWSDVLGIEPYFDQPFYVGFDAIGYELGLDPNGQTLLLKVTNLNTQTRAVTYT